MEKYLLKEVVRLRNIVISIPNSLMASCIERFLRDDRELRVFKEDRPQQAAELCRNINADILLVEIRDTPPYSIDDWMKICELQNTERLNYRIACIVDENTYPESAREVALAKSDLLIDAFFYSSSNINGEYLTAVISSL